VALPSFLQKFRNRLLADPKFLNFAQRFPLTRPIARARSRDLFDLLAGFSYSQVLFACVKLRVLEHVGQTAIAPDSLAKAVGLEAAKCAVLVNAAVALHILNRDKNMIVLGPHGAALLGQPWIMRFIEHHAYFYRDLADPVAMLRGSVAPDGLRSYWTYGHSDSDKSAYSELMAASQAAVSQQILGAYNFSVCKNMLDIGGGTGAFLRAVGQNYPYINLHLFDLPGVVQLAEPAPNLTLHGGDFRLDRLPTEMDLISLIRVLHDHDDDVVLGLLRKVRDACTPATVLMIAEPFAGSKANARVTDAYFNIYFAAMGQGRTRRPDEIAALAARAGFGHPKVWPTTLPLIAGLMTLKPT
jgi:demethylspheroidene O-methyltransferase